MKYILILITIEYIIVHMKNFWVFIYIYIYIDNNFTFDEHVTSQKLHSLERVSSHVTTEQYCKIMKAYINY